MAAGASVYLFCLNRYLIQLRDGPYKSPLIRIAAIVAVGIAGIAGYALAGTRWIVAPLAVLVVAVCGEIRRLLMHRRARGELPVMLECSAEAERASSACAPHSRRRPNTTTDLVLRRYTLPVTGWDGPALRIAHVSDFHLNSHLPLSYFEDTMHRVADAQPDLLLLTGDYITFPRYIDLVPHVLAIARGRLGTFGILGNHDYWADPELVAEAVAAAGVTLLRDETTRLDVGGGHVVTLAGCEAPWSRRDAQPSAATNGDLSVILTHTPDNVYRLSRLGFAAIFAGHCHAGQMRLPVLGPLVVPSRYGRRFDHGRFIVNGTHLFVTAGVGSAEPPLRLWCQPDVLIVDVEGAT
jgi:predicted MPP superfamily phosphohydrolase